MLLITRELTPTSH